MFAHYIHAEGTYPDCPEQWRNHEALPFQVMRCPVCSENFARALERMGFTRAKEDE